MILTGWVSDKIENSVLPCLENMSMFKKKEMKIKLHLQIISKFNLQKIDTENSFSRQFEAHLRKRSL